jgi:hypothetical protein
LSGGALLHAPGHVPRSNALPEVHREPPKPIVVGR